MTDTEKQSTCNHDLPAFSGGGCNVSNVNRTKKLKYYPETGLVYDDCGNLLGKATLLKNGMMSIEQVPNDTP